MSLIILEAAIAIALLASSSLILSGTSYGISIENKNAMNQNNAAYDIFVAVLKNKTYNSCVENSNYSCVTGLLRKSSAFYYLSYASLSYGDSYFEYGNGSLCRYKTQLCMPLAHGTGFYVSCETLCSD